MASHPVKILIVEDDNLIAKDLATDLREVGYAVTHIADNKDDALQSIKQEKPDLAIVDIELNIKGSRQKDTLGGIELVKALTKSHNIPCLYYTGFGADQGIIDQANKSSHIGILVKSSPFLQVKIAIQSALKKFWEAEKKRTLPSFLFANGTLKIRQLERQFLAKIQIGYTFKLSIGWFLDD